MADFIIPLISTGTGVGVSTFKLSVNSNTTMSIDGNGVFYDDAAGTTNSGTTRSITTGAIRTFYLKVTSGTCNITIVDGGTKMIRWVEWTSGTNAASVNGMDLNTLPTTLTFFYCAANNTVTGNLSSLPSGMTFFYCTGTNTITGNLTSLPSVMDSFYCIGNNTITGNLSNLPAIMTVFDCRGSNTITGNLYSIPSGMTFFYCTGNNTINSYTAGKTFSNAINYLYFIPVTSPPATANLADIVGKSGDCGGNSGVTFTTASTIYYKHTSGACNWADAKWYSDISPRTVATRVPLPQDSAVFDANSFTGTSTITFNSPRYGSVNMSGVTQTVTQTLGNVIECYGHYVLGTNITPSGSYILTLMGRGNYNINVYAKYVYGLLQNSITGTYTNQNILNQAGGDVTITSGVFDFNDYDSSMRLFIQNGSNASTYLGNGVITLNRTASTVWSVTSGNIYCELSTIKVVSSGQVGDIILNTGNKIYNKIWISGAITAYGFVFGNYNSTIAELIIDKGCILRLTGGSNQTINKFTDNGTTVDPIYLSSTNTTPATLIYTGTSYQQLQHSNISYIAATPANKWYAGLGSTNVTGNTGWVWKGFLSLGVNTIKQVKKDETDTGWYGVKWDTTASTTTMTRTGNLQLHRDLPIQNKMLGCLVSDAGAVTYLPAGTWTGSTLNGTAGQVMVEIPQHYRYFPPAVGTVFECRISPYPLPGYTLVPKSYISAFEASVERSSNKLSSVVNATTAYRGGNNAAANDLNTNTLLGKPATSITRANFRTYARNRGTGWEMLDYKTYNSMFWLYFVEYANTNSQAAINAALDANGFKQGGLGPGVTEVVSADWSTFNAYYPIVNCGASNSLGNRSGEVVTAVPFSTPITVKVNRYRGIENPFGHIWKNCDGILFDVKTAAGGGTSKAYICNTPANYSDTLTTGYTFLGDIPRNDGYVKTLQSGSFIPSVTTGASTSTYWCDYFYQDISVSSLRTLLLGGSADYGASAGLGDSYTNLSVSHARTYIGSRLCFFP